MTLNINFFFTSPIEAVRVTPKNMEEVAAWCGGRVATVESRKVKGRMDPYVWVPTPEGSKISWAFAGMWITKRLAITENNEIKETFSVFRKDYFSKNYFEDPSIALEDTWGRAQKERDHKARQARTITVELPEGADIEAAKAEILAQFVPPAIDAIQEVAEAERAAASISDPKQFMTDALNKPLSPVEQRQLIIEEDVEAESLEAKESAIASERIEEQSNISASNDPRLI